MKLLDSELKILTLLWEHGELTAKELYHILQKTENWKKNTTYTVLKRSIDKGLIIRLEPHFVCRAAKTKMEFGIQSVEEVIHQLFDDSKTLFLASFLQQSHFTKQELEQARSLLNQI